MASKARYRAMAHARLRLDGGFATWGTEKGIIVRPQGASMYDRDELIKRRDELIAKIEKLEDIHREVLEILYEIRFHNGMMDIVESYTNEAINKLTRY